eukprot:snap_masked-scaffold_3-processed-gene-17.30-mRNA-1 protein AED:1.00 eAED:1.00 QI:0/0/0/0/1/1/4/0/82
MKAHYFEEIEHENMEQLFRYMKDASSESVKHNTVVKFYLFKRKHGGGARFNLFREKLTVVNKKTKEASQYEYIKPNKNKNKG